VPSPDRNRLALDLVAEIDACPDSPAVVERAQSLFGLFGFTAFACGGRHLRGGSHVDYMYANTWGRPWNEVYYEGLAEHDLVPREASRRSAPFTWTDLLAGSPMKPRERLVIDSARDFGWSDGLVLPLHGPGPYVGILSLVTDRLDLSATDRAALHLAGFYVHERLRALSRPVPSNPVASLSPREREVLRLVADGKSDWDIGQILAISETTAHFHVERAKRKLGVKNRTQAVAVLILGGGL
jgi:DNA-binding CsgD family transcriptional regulator